MNIMHIMCPPSQTMGKLWSNYQQTTYTLRGNIRHSRNICKPHKFGFNCWYQALWLSWLSCPLPTPSPLVALPATAVAPPGRILLASMPTSLELAMALVLAALLAVDLASLFLPQVSSARALPTPTKDAGVVRGLVVVVALVILVINWPNASC